MNVIYRESHQKLNFVFLKHFRKHLMIRVYTEANTEKCFCLMGAVFIVGLLKQTEGKILSQTKLNEHDFYTQTVS